MERVLSRKESKDLTRRRLIDGAIQLLRAEGLAAATTGRIAAQAGIKQSSFYGHFADRDACLEAAAAVISRRMIDRSRASRAHLGDAVGGDRRGLRRLLAAPIDAVLDAFVGEPELTRMFLRYRGDDQSPIGAVFRAHIAEVHRELQGEMMIAGLVDDRSRAEVFAELLIAGTLGLTEGLLDGRVSDRACAVDSLAELIAQAIASAMSIRDQARETP